jgi:hypothetical protein
MDRLPELIQEYVKVEIHGQTYHLADALMRYDPKSSHHYGSVQENASQSEQIRYYRKKHGPKPDVIYHLTYFHLYPSVLFNDVVNDPRQDIPNFPGEYEYYIDYALHRITKALGSQMTYDGVVYALTKLNTDASLNFELEVLLSNERLAITSTDITIFRAVKLLYDISQPLQGFIKTCVQYKFQVVMSDAHFHTLQAAVTTFYTSQSNDCPTCLSFLDDLYRNLCINPYIHSSVRNQNNPDRPIFLLHKINELTNLIPILLPLSYVSHGPKLWQYFREMGWFEPLDDDKNNDLGRIFDEDYRSLSTTLLSYGASHEALIVQSLGPVARLFIAVEELGFCQNIYVLLMHVRQHNKIKRIIQSTESIPVDIHKLNSRWIAIKDLFLRVIHLPSHRPTQMSQSTTPPSYYAMMPKLTPDSQPLATATSTVTVTQASPSPYDPSLTQSMSSMPAGLETTTLTTSPSTSTTTIPQPQMNLLPASSQQHRTGNHDIGTITTGTPLHHRSERKRDGSNPYLLHHDQTNRHQRRKL